LIDKAHSRYLDSSGFGVRDHRSRAGLWVSFAFLLLAAGLAGCGSQHRPGVVEDSLTSGRITIECAPEARDLVLREREAFQVLYPQAHIEVRFGSSRDAVSALFAARCDAAVITRELSPEERAAAVRGGLELEGYRFARDALVAIVNAANPVQNASVPELRGMYSGKIQNWGAVAGANRAIRPVVQPMESDVTAFFLDRVMGGEPITAPVLTETGDSAVVARVTRDRDAVGFVTLAWASRGVRPLRVSALTGLPYEWPDPESVYQGKYPMSRFFNFYVRTGGPLLADGFITFTTSRHGQQIVHDAGLVPTSVPVRFVRRSPMLKSH
jgi:phosphate transport system substrate-binding protein